MTKAQLLKLARTRWPKSKFIAMRHRRALKRSDRLAAAEERLRCSVRIKELDAAIKRLGDVLGPLMDAAEFVVDVAGDPPSIPELQTALAAAHRRENLRVERTELYHRKIKLSGKVYPTPYSLGRQVGLCRVIDGQGDSWEEVAREAGLLEDTGEARLCEDVAAAVETVINADHVKAIAAADRLTEILP